MWIYIVGRWKSFLSRFEGLSLVLGLWDLRKKIQWWISKMLRNCKVASPRKALKGKFNGKSSRARERGKGAGQKLILPLFSYCTAICSGRQCLSKFEAVLSSSKFRSCTAHSALRLHLQQMQLLACEPKTMFLWGRNFSACSDGDQHQIESNQGQSQ